MAILGNFFMDKAKKTFFDNQDQRFFNSIYKTAKGEIRLAVLKRDLEPLIKNHKKLKILDIGAGGGQMAIWAASFGHQVKIIDISQNMLNAAKENIKNFSKGGFGGKPPAGGQGGLVPCGVKGEPPCGVLGAEPLEERISLEQGDILELEISEKYDLIFCHAVLEWVEEGEKLLNKCQELLNQDGYLSLLFYNPLALFYIHNVFGNFDYLDKGLKSSKAAKLTPKYPKSPEWVAEKINLTLKTRSLVRVFYDYMKEKDRKRWDLNELIKRELTLSQNYQFQAVARYIHNLYSVRS